MNKIVRVSSDQELLALVAKIAGLQQFSLIGGRYCVRNRYNGPQDWDPWNPLEDDGDALRLAVSQLNWPHGGRAFDQAVTILSALGRLPKDPYEATRRAIVMAVYYLKAPLEANGPSG